MQAYRCWPSRLLLAVGVILLAPAQASGPVPGADSTTELLEFLGALEADGWRQWTEFFNSLPESFEELPADTGQSGNDEGESS